MTHEKDSGVGIGATHRAEVADGGAAPGLESRPATESGIGVSGYAGAAVGDWGAATSDLESRPSSEWAREWAQAVIAACQVRHGWGHNVALNASGESIAAALDAAREAGLWEAVRVHARESDDPEEHRAFAAELERAAGLAHPRSETPQPTDNDHTTERSGDPSSKSPPPCAAPATETEAVRHLRMVCEKSKAAREASLRAMLLFRPGSEGSLELSATFAAYWSAVEEARGFVEALPLVGP